MPSRDSKTKLERRLQRFYFLTVLLYSDEAFSKGLGSRPIFVEFGLRVEVIWRFFVVFTHRRRAHGATVARSPPERKVGCSNHSGLTFTRSRGVVGYHVRL